MAPKVKFGILFALGFAVCLVWQKGSQRQMIDGKTMGDNARRNFYGMAGGAALVLMSSPTVTLR